MSVDGDVVRAEKGAAEPAVVSAGILFVHADYHQTLIGRFDEFVTPGAVLVRYLIAALFLAVMIPSDFLIRQHFGHLHETAQMHRLAPGHD